MKAINVVLGIVILIVSGVLIFPLIILLWDLYTYREWSLLYQIFIHKDHN